LENELAEIIGRRSTIAAVEVGLVVILAYIAASLFWTVTSGPANAGAEVQSGFLGPSGSSAARDFSVLASFDPFHRGEMSGGTQTAETVAPPETTLDIKLFGIRLATGDSKGSAVIRLQDYRHAVLAVGDEISPGIMLSDIHSNYVVLDRQGRRETLYLDPQNQQRDPLAMPTTSGPSPAQPAGSAESQTPEQVFDNIGFSPELASDGTVAGYAISIADDANFSPEIDLRSGDIIVEVNGVSAGEVARFAELRQSLQNATSADIVVERDGERRTIQLGRP